MRTGSSITPSTGTEGVPGGVEGGVPGGVVGGVVGGLPEAPPPPPPPPQQPIRVGGNIKTPTKIREVKPVYPPIAQSARVQGVVIIEATIGADGRVKDAKVLRSIPLLDQAALDAVKQWQFTPTLLNVVPVPVIMTVTINFKLLAPPRREETLASLSDSDPEIRWAAIRWLGRYRPVTGEQMTAIERALQDPSELVRSAANEALARLQAK